MDNLTILSSAPEFSAAALHEAQEADSTLQLKKELEPGISLVAGSLAFDRFSQRLNAQEPIFLRHLCPVALTLSLGSEPSGVEKLAKTIAALPEAARLQPGTPFSVQVRFAGNNQSRPFSAYAVKEIVAVQLAEKVGAVEEIKAPRVIISIVIDGQTAYAGISTPTQNLSSWAGGMRRFAREDAQISRAEFKLEEAREVFGFSLPSEGAALDLGAAPGGWTRLLLVAGLEVVAVDPAELDPRLVVSPQLDHFRGLADEYLRLARKRHRRFEIIASDLRMDAQMAAALMGRASNLLKPDGFALTTLKLPHAGPKLDPLTIVHRSLTVLRQSYRTVKARQLFHNRQEVTVYLKP